MEFNFNNITSDVYYTLDNDLNVKEYKDLESAIAAQPELYIIVQETKGTWINYVGFSYYFINQGIKIRVFNNLGHQVSTLNEKGWSLDSMGIEDRGNYQLTAFHARIVDPRRYTFMRQYYGDGFRGFRKCIKSFHEASHFDCIENYVLSNKNRDLQQWSVCKDIVLGRFQALRRRNQPELGQFDNWEQDQLLIEQQALHAKLELLTQEKNKLQAMLDNSD